MSNNRGMDKEDMIHIYNGILAIKKNEIMPFVATWMDLEIIILSEISQKEKNKYRMLTYIYMDSKKKNGSDEPGAGQE